MYTSDWIKVTDEDRMSYFIKDSELTQSYFKSVLVENEIVGGDLSSLEYPLQSQVVPEW